MRARVIRQAHEREDIAKAAMALVPAAPPPRNDTSPGVFRSKNPFEGLRNFQTAAVDIRETNQQHLPPEKPRISKVYRPFDPDDIKKRYSVLLTKCTGSLSVQTQTCGGVYLAPHRRRRRNIRGDVNQERLVAGYVLIPSCQHKSDGAGREVQASSVRRSTPKDHRWNILQKARQITPETFGATRAVQDKRQRRKGKGGRATKDWPPEGEHCPEL